MPNFNQHVIAHRGASHIAPENTLAAFKKAHDLGIKWVEFDVMLTKDGITVVFHDDTLNRTSNGNGFIDAMLFEEIEKLDAGSWFGSAFAGEKIPTLTQVVQCLRERGMFANVEIKTLHDNDELVAEKTFKTITDILPVDNEMFLFSSFSTRALKKFRELAPQAKLGLLLDEWVDHWEELNQELGCCSINLNHEVLTPERAKTIKDKGYALLCYTVDDPVRANELISWGVDAVFSNNPSVILTPEPPVTERRYCRM